MDEKRKVFMTTPNGNVGGFRGDSMRAALATLLNLPWEEVPAFEQTVRGAEFWKKFHEYLSARNLVAIPLHDRRAPHGLYLACGKANDGRGHVVVMRDGCVVHDPLGGNGLFETETIIFITPEDPAKAC